MKVSLIIPAYNEEKYIEQCLTSVLESAKKSAEFFHEIIVVNNGSTDTTAALVQKFPQVRIVTEQRQGVMFARQKGYEEATGDIIAYTDADTLMPAGWYEKIEKQFSDNTQLVCLSGPYEYYDADRWQKIYSSIFFHIAKFFSLVFGHVVIGGNFAIKKETLFKMNGMDTLISFYGDDANIGRRAHMFGKVLFSLDFVMLSSSRRLVSQGIVKTFSMYAVCYFSEAIFKKNIFFHYENIR